MCGNPIKGLKSVFSKPKQQPVQGFAPQPSGPSAADRARDRAQKARSEGLGGEEKGEGVDVLGGGGGNVRRRGLRAR